MNPGCTTLAAISLAESSLHWWKTVLFVHSWWKSACLDYRWRGEQTAACCVQEVVPFGGGSAMVWGRICRQKKTGHLAAKRYIDDILRPTVLLFLRQQPRGVIATPGFIHIESYTISSKSTTSMCRCLLHSPNTTSMGCQGSLCSTTFTLQPTNKNWFQALQREWLYIPCDLIRQLTSSMCLRGFACVETRGHWTWKEGRKCFI